MADVQALEAGSIEAKGARSLNTAPIPAPSQRAPWLTGEHEGLLVGAGAFGGDVSACSPFDSFFQLRKRGTTVANELRGGLVLFATVSYLLVLNAHFLSFACGVAVPALLASTAIVCAIGTALIGLMSNLPCVLAPGLGLSAYFAFSMLEVWSFGSALAICLFASLLLLFAALLGWSQSLMRIVPASIQTATVVGIGFLVALIGLQNMGVARSPAPMPSGDATELTSGFHVGSLLVLGDVSSPLLWVSVGGFFLLLTLFYHGVRAAALISIGAMSVASWLMSHSFPSGFVGVPSLSSVADVVSIDLHTVASLRAVGPVLSLAAVSLIDTSGMLHVMHRACGLGPSMQSHPCSARGAYIATALGSAAACALGCPPVIIAVESATAVKSGARTGLAALMAATLFLLSLFVSPLLSAVPPLATAPVLVLLGALLMAECAQIPFDSLLSAVPAFITIVIIAVTYSISAGIGIGLGVHVLLWILSGSWLGHLPWRGSKLPTEAEEEYHHHQGEAFAPLENEDDDETSSDVFLSPSNGPAPTATWARSLLVAPSAPEQIVGAATTPLPHSLTSILLPDSARLNNVSVSIPRRALEQLIASRAAAAGGAAHSQTHAALPRERSYGSIHLSQSSELP